TAPPALVRGTVAAVSSEAVVVTVPGHDAQTCDVLESVRTGLLADGDVVLLWLPRGAGERGVILGRLRSGVLPTTDGGTGDDLVIEANQCLTLKCGSGSITIREDGKILIKGKDLVSHATRMNRITGGSVPIN